MGASIKARQQAAGAAAARRGRHAPMSEINVTPMVDVMLVLLIIFMVAAPLLQVGVPIELPQAKGKQLDSRSKEPLAITSRPTATSSSARRRCRSTRSRPSSRRSPRTATTSRSSCAATRASTYGIVMRVMGRISAGGFRKVSLVTEVEEGG